MICAFASFDMTLLLQIYLHCCNIYNTYIYIYIYTMLQHIGIYIYVAGVMFDCNASAGLSTERGACTLGLDTLGTESDNLCSYWHHFFLVATCRMAR